MKYLQVLIIVAFAAIITTLPLKVETNPPSVQINSAAAEETTKEDEPVNAEPEPVVVQPTIVETPVTNIPDYSNGSWRTAMDFYISRGFTKVAAANLAGTIMQESGFKPNGACGDGGLACGLYQWHPGRRAALPATFAGQLEYSIVEMQRDSPAAYTTLTTTNNNYEARVAIKSWIRWGHLGSRWIYADQYLAQY